MMVVSQELCEQFPGCTVVWTHRNPSECVASACSLYETIMRMAMEEPSVDPMALGRAVLRYTELALQKAEASLSLLGERMRVVHVRYADSVQRPKEVVKAVFQQTDMAFSADYEARLDAFLVSNAEQRRRMSSLNRKAFHSYRPEHYGLSEPQLRAAFQGYIDKYRL